MTAHVSWDDLVAYWANDLEGADVDRVDEHLIACAACTAISTRLATIATSIRDMIPPIVSPDLAASLRARGLRVVDNVIPAGGRQEGVFGADVDVLLHHLSGLDLASAERVHVTVRVEETDDVILDVPRAPFDAERGEVLIACQRHFAAFPPNIVFDVRVHEESGAERATSYFVPHVFR